MGLGCSVPGKGTEQADVVLLEREEVENLFLSGGNKQENQRKV